MSRKSRLTSAAAPKKPRQATPEGGWHPAPGGVRQVSQLLQASPEVLRQSSPEVLRAFLDAKAEEYNVPGFIENDPVCIPHRFSHKQDIEIMGFWAAVLAWGQRKTIIAKCEELIRLMDGAPYEFVTGHQDSDLKRFLNFRHRTFNATDTLYFLEFFRAHYLVHESLEDAFVLPAEGDEPTGEPSLSGGSESAGLREDTRKKSRAPASAEEPVEVYLNRFSRRFFSLPDFPQRTKKHIPSPERNSACKRLNMFLRWMVRTDEKGVDFGLWKRIRPDQLICPCDVHVERAAHRLGLITHPGGGWKTAMELTLNLRKLDPSDPVKYDFALFGMGVNGEI